MEGRSLVVVSEAPAYPIASVENVLRALELLRDRPTVTLSEVARELGVARSTAHRLLAMLRFHDFVRQNPETKAYGPGGRLLELALAVTGERDVRALLRGELERLSAEVGETAHLVTLHGADALFLDSVECDRIVRVSSRAGVYVPAWLTAAGKALLAQLPPQRASELLPTRHRTELLGALRLVRRRGYATNFGESESELAAVAVALAPAGALERRLSVSVSAPAYRLTEREVRGVAAAAGAAARRMTTLLATGTRT